MLKIFIGLFLLCTIVKSSPVAEVIDKQIKEFNNALHELYSTVEKHQFHEEDFDPKLYNETQTLKNAEDYDFIIVGAGGAGAVVANRLSENTEWKILLLEAGGPETEITKVPQMCGLLQKTPYNWGYVTVPQKNWCQGMIDNKCAVAGGKALGGSTAMNGMLYIRGNAKDFDLWADQGNEGWRYNDVLKYFKKAEDVDLVQSDDEYHNHGGPFHIENPQYLTKLHKIALEAGKETGLNTIDYNGKSQLGLGVVQINSKHGKRHSTSEAYLVPAKQRSNLVVKPFAHVTQILIDSDKKEATGVKYLQDGKLQAAKASKEVILSAGAINTPQLLMLSGVGPKDQLDKLGISVIRDAKVGQNLKDHIGFFGLDYLSDTNLEEESEKDKDPVIEYLKNGKGPYTTTGTEVLGYTYTSANNLTLKSPDIELFFSLKKISGKSDFNPFRFRDEIYDSLWQPHNGRKAINFGIMLAHPKSTGSVSLKDKDPLHLPLVDPNQLSDPDDNDLNIMLAGIRKAISIAETKAMKKLNLKINDKSVKGCESLKWGSDEYWKCAIRHLSISLRHLTGTARMGPPTDKDAVVDNNLKVYGIEKLRVVDNSVIPVTVTGHTMAPAIMIGEKGSDIIKTYWEKKAP